ncbi:MAG: carbonic anhydrase family protein [Longimicrobiales bacterium]|nr:carbonic anhydrase family protein [Longimicrobiales bacterium]
MRGHDDGHTVQIDYAPGSTLSVGAHTYELKQLHFHAPSEHTIDGHPYPLEEHLVHADAEGHLAVVSVLFEEGKANLEMARAWSRLPGGEGEPRRLEPPLLDARRLLPPRDDHFQYNGSLTTPPCTEGVAWIVMEAPSELSAEQLDALVHAMHEPNNRPVQPVHSRVVVE